MKQIYYLIIIGIFLISLTSAVNNKYSNCEIYGTCNTKSSTTTTINNYTNVSVNVNTTQFDSSDPIHIKESWLTNFIQAIVGAYNYITGNDVPDYEEDPYSYHTDKNINATGYNLTIDNVNFLGGNITFNGTDNIWNFK